LTRTKKILLFGLVIAASILVAISCAPQAEEEPEEVEQEEEEVEVIEEELEEDETLDEDEEEKDENEKNEDKATENTGTGVSTDSTFKHEVDIKTDGEIKEGVGEEWWKEENRNGDEWWKSD